MKFNKWTLGLAALGVVSLASVVQAEERTNPVLTALSSTTISGYVDTSMIWKIGRGNYPLPGRAYDGADKQDGINLNVVGITIEKPLDETEWAAGYKVDLLFGPDAEDYGTTLDSGGNRDQFAIKQAYVALRAPLGNGLDFKIGVYDNPLRYESFESFRNPNYSRSYGYLLEPNAFTGVNISYKFTDWLTVFGGVADSPSNEINARAWKGIKGYDPVTGKPYGYESENVKTYYGGITLTAPSDLGFLEGSTLTVGAYDGLPHDTSSVGTPTKIGDTTGLFVAATINTPVKGLAFGGAFDYRWQRNDALYTVPGVGTRYGNEYAVGAYLVYTGIEKWKFALRGDYYNSGLNNGNPYSFYASSNEEGAELLAVTATADYQLWQNVITRLEFRWDHDLTGLQPSSLPNSNGPFADDDNNAFSLALNIVYRF